MQKASYIAENAYEELIETGLDECLLSEMQGYINKFSNEEGNCAFNASMAMVTAVGQGISMYISWKVSEILVESMIKKAGAYWAYINFGKFKKFLVGKAGKFGKAGHAVMKNFIMSDTTSNRIETMKLVQTEVNRFDTNSHAQQQIMGQNLQTLEHKKDKLYKVNAKHQTKSLEAFRHKILTSSWTNSTADKKLFESVTGLKSKHVSGTTAWSKRYKELNTLSTFAKDSEGNLINFSQALLKSLVAGGLK